MKWAWLGVVNHRDTNSNAQKMLWFHPRADWIIIWGQMISNSSTMIFFIKSLNFSHGQKRAWPWAKGTIFEIFHPNFFWCLEPIEHEKHHEASARTWLCHIFVRYLIIIHKILILDSQIENKVSPNTSVRSDQMYTGQFSALTCCPPAIVFP